MKVKREKTPGGQNERWEGESPPEKTEDGRTRGKVVAIGAGGVGGRDRRGKSYSGLDSLNSDSEGVWGQ